MTLQTETTLIGRDRELRELVEALDDTASGRGSLILIGGEPGIGKSRLADELATVARERGHLVLWGRGWEDAGAPPYWPWVQAMRGYLRASSDDEIREHVGAGAVDVAQMVPDLRGRLTDVPPSPDFSTESARFQLFDSTATLLRNAARTRPIVIVLDDLHSADIPSLLFLRFLASQLRDMRVLLVGTYRDVALSPEHPLTSAIEEMSRERVTRLIHLAGLPAEAVGAYLGAAANLTPSDQLVAGVWRATGGNPLFVGEALRLLAAEGRLGDFADVPSLRVTIPAGVRAVIARRIGHLNEATIDALRLGAVLGPEFSVDLLRRIADNEVGDPLDLVDEAVQAGLLLPVSGTIDRYRFSHDLVRETLYADLAAGRRVRLHQRIADTLDDAASAESHLAELAYHYAQAAQGAKGNLTPGDLSRVGPKAIEYARRAGDAAARSLAYEEAVRLYRMALAVLDLNLPDQDTRAETLLALGEVHARAGDLEGGRAAFLGAAEIARETGNGQQLARAALGYGGRHIWARAGRDTHQIPLLQDALKLLADRDEPLRVRLLGRLACAWRSAPERQRESEALGREAVEIARARGDLATLSYALSANLQATWWPDNPAGRRSIAQEMVRIAETLGDGERLADAHEVLCHALMEIGDIAAARTELSNLGRVVREFRQPTLLWLELASASEIALLEGDFGAAEDLTNKEAAWDRPVTAAADDLSSARFHRFLLRREQGRLAEEEATVRQSASELPWYPIHRAALACLLCDLGRPAEARAVFDALAANEFAAMYRDSEWLVETSLVSDACAMLGDTEAAATLYAQLVPFAGRHAVGHPEGSVGAVDRYLGLLAATLGRLDDAVRHLTAAIEVNERMGAHPWTAHSRHDLAEVLRRRDAGGDRAEATRLDRMAAEAATALGMALAGRIAPEVVSSPEPMTTGPVTAASLRREGEYWSIEFDREVLRVRDLKGMRHLARLLRSPGQEVHVLELAQLDGAAPAASTLASPRSGRDEAGADAFGDLGPVLDSEAKAAYRERLDSIREDLAEAEAWNDPERVFRLQAEERAITRELAGALGLGGRDRPAASSTERARLSVTRALRSALARIGDQDQPLGHHFDATIRTGNLLFIRS